MKTRPIRVGDRVVIMCDRFIKRIGYPLVWYDLTDEVEADPRTAAALRVLGWADRRMPREFVTAVAKMRVEQRGFGGRERQIFYEEPGGYGRWKGSVSVVHAKRTAMTGTYYPPRSGRSSYDGEPWDEPGGLENRKTHIILTTDVGDIEACDVELVTP